MNLTLKTFVRYILIHIGTYKKNEWFQIDKNKIKRIISERVNNKKTVQFKTNSLYCYFNVSEYVDKSLLSSKSNRMSIKSVLF